MLVAVSERFLVERRLTAILAADVAGYSRLMSFDESGTLASLQAHRSELIVPAIARHRGRIVKLMGDGILAEFGSVVEAVECAAEIQREMAARNAGVSDDRRMGLRIGVHLGDVIVEGYDQVDGKLPLEFRELGPQHLKNIPKPVEVFAIGALSGTPRRAPTNLKQEIHYCRAPDGVRLAYTSVGNGPPLVKTANWFNHLEYDWTSPVWRYILSGLASQHTLIRYDRRGSGLSDWEDDELSLDAWVRDLETIVDTVGIQRFPLLGISQGCAISIAYAVRHPQRVSHLVLYGGFA